MNPQSAQKIAQLDWPELEQQLAAPPSRATREAASEPELREFFGEAEFEFLRKLAAHARQTRELAPLRGNIVLLPGIMGSDLAVEEDGSPKKVWVNFGRLILGAVGKLRLADDGATPTDTKCHVLATGLDKRTYSRAVLWLRAHWNVETFPFDWRKDLNDAASKLAALIQEKFTDQPVHLVAHSMGGLVSRAFIRLFPKLWQDLRDPSRSRGGRLIMLGTPNCGSYTIPQVFTGKEKVVRLLAAADLRHSLSELLDILASFVGSYQMLPSPARIPVGEQVLYRPEMWGRFGVSPQHLARAFQTHSELERDAPGDPERMLYVAGSNQETLSGIEVLGPGDFRYTTTWLGDGRVPHALGLLPGVRSYFVEEVHGDLPRNETVLTAVEELLQTGQTALLPPSPPAVRAVVAEGARWRQSPAVRSEEARVRQLAEKAAQDRADPAEIREAETTLTSGLLTRSVPARTEPALRAPAGAAPRKEFRLAVEVICQDITQVDAPLVSVGHYRGVEPVNAEGALDRALGHLIRDAGRLGIIGGDLGELFFIPAAIARPNRGRKTGKSPLKTDAVVLAGMGSPGTFGRDELRYLASNLALAALGLGVERFATVLIGAGNGGLPRARALRSLLQGVYDGLCRWQGRAIPLRALWIIEREPDRAREIQQVLEEIQRNPDGLVLQVRKHSFPASAPARRAEAVAATDTSTASIAIERESDLFRFSAITDSAVVPVREVTLQSFLVEGIAQRLKQAATLAEQEQFGRLLYTYLLPEDFQRLFSEQASVTLMLDRASAAFPWEMACFGAPGGVRWFGTHLRLTRQFRTLLSRAPGTEPPLNRALRVLVIADPAPELELRLAGARREGRRVVEVLNEIKRQAERQEPALEVDIVDRIGAEECDPIEILSLLLSGDFDVVHFAGHGFFDEQHPDRGGWVFGRDRILSAREIFRARRVPRLVVANACFSAVVRPGRPFTPQETDKAMAGLAEAFFERGVQNFIGSGWPVDDAAAVTFAETLYRQALGAGPVSLRDAVRAARESIQTAGTTWGAYQQYGSGATQLITPPEM